MKNEDKYYRTTSFQTATFLYAKGRELVNIDKLENQKRATFVFLGSPYVEELAHEFSFAKEDSEIVMVDARKLAYAMKALKEKLYQDKF